MSIQIHWLVLLDKQAHYIGEIYESELQCCYKWKKYILRSVTCRTEVNRYAINPPRSGDKEYVCM